MDDFPPRWPSRLHPKAPDQRPSLPTIPLGAADNRMSFADLRSIIGVLLRRWKLISAIFLLVMLSAGTVLYFIPPQYRASVQLLIADPREPTNAADDRNLSSLDVDAAAVTSEMEVMQSRSILLAVVQKLGLDKDPEFARQSRLTSFLEWAGLEHQDNSPNTAALPATGDDDAVPSPATERAVNALRNRLTVEREQFSYVLTASVLSEVPDKARRIAAAVADAYLNARLEARYQAAQRATVWLSGRLAELRQRVAADDAAIAKLKAANNLSDTGPNTNLSQQQIADINAQLIIARADAAEKRARYDQVSRAVAGGGNLSAIPEVMSSPVIGQLRLQQATLSQKAAELQTHYGDRYPELINTQSQLADIEKQIRAEVSRTVADIKNQFDIANQRVASLETSLTAATAQTGNSQALLQLQDLQRTAESNRKLYEYFLNEYNEIDQRSTLSDTGARTISPASTPDTIAYPRRVLVMILSALVGLLGGIVLAFLAEFLDSGFKTTLQIEQTLGHPVLGMVPRFKGSVMKGQVKRTDILEYLLGSPFSQIAEAIRSIRLGVAMSDVDSPPRTLLVTSSVPDEGKTTAAMLIAASAALSQQKTILVDCDLRRRSISATLGVEGKPGLVDVLADKATLKDVVFQDETARFSILPGGTHALNIIDLLSSHRMVELVAELRAQYDCVVLDVAPLMAVADAVVLSKLADKVLLVVEWSHTPRTTVIDSLKLLNRDSAKLAGIMLNKVDFKRLRSHGYGYGSGYNYGYYYRKMDTYYHEA